MIETIKNRWISPPPQIHLWQDNKLVKGPEGTGPAYVIVSRRYCRFRTFDMPGQRDGAKELAAATLKINDWAPFKPFGMRTVKIGKRQMVWAWSKQAADEMMAQNDVNHRRARVVPETLMVAPGDDGARIVATLEGFEGQIWAQGILVESRWWSQAPSAVEWVAFQRAAGTKPNAMTAEPPAALHLPWLHRPWGAGDGSIRDMIQSLSPADMAAAAAIFVLAPLFFLAAEALHVRASLAQADARIAELESTAGPILNARESAQKSLVRVKALTSVDPYPPQISVLAKVASLIPGDNVRFVEWFYQNGDLEVSLQSTNTIDAKSYIQNFEGSGAFKDVTVDRTNPVISKLKMKVLPRDQVRAPMPVASAEEIPPAILQMLQSSGKPQVIGNGNAPISSVMPAPTQAPPGPPPSPGGPPRPGAQGNLPFGMTQPPVGKADLPPPMMEDAPRSENRPSR